METLVVSFRSLLQVPQASMTLGQGTEAWSQDMGMQPVCLQQGAGKPHLFVHTLLLLSFFQAPDIPWLLPLGLDSAVTKVFFGAHPIPTAPTLSQSCSDLQVQPLSHSVLPPLLPSVPPASPGPSIKTHPCLRTSAHADPCSWKNPHASPSSFMEPPQASVPQGAQHLNKMCFSSYCVPIESQPCG